MKGERETEKGREGEIKGGKDAGRKKKGS